MHVTIPVHTQVVNGRQIPKIDISNFAVTFDTRKIVISLGGGILADIADLFIGLFKSTIIKLIANGINASVPTTLENLIQRNLVASQGILPIYHGLAFDF